jgi:hypothetical protein
MDEGIIKTDPQLLEDIHKTWDEILHAPSHPTYLGFFEGIVGWVSTQWHMSSFSCKVEVVV